MTTENKSYDYSYSMVIYKANEDALDVELAKLIMKAQHYGFGLKYRKELIDDGAQYPRLKVTFLMTVPVVKYGDYEYVATLKRENPKLHKTSAQVVSLETPTKILVEDIHTIAEKTKIGNQVFTAAAFKDEDFSGYFKSEFHCDHCSTNRYRLTAYLFRDPSNSKELMISTACSKEYFGVRVDTMIRSIYRMVERLSTYKKRAANRDRKHFAQKFDTEGFCKRRYENAVKGYADYPSYYGTTPIDPSKWPAWDFKNVLNFWAEKAKADPTNRNVNNILVALGMFKPQYGYVSTAIHSYIKATVASLTPALPVSKVTEDYSEGTRVVKAGTVTHCERKTGMFGAYYAYRLQDSDNELLYYEVNTGFDGLRVGDRVKADGVVKRTFKNSSTNRLYVTLNKCYLKKV